jgi:hypothetical protein
MDILEKSSKDLLYDESNGYTDYVKDEKWIGLPIPLHEGKLRGRGRMGQKSFVDRDYSLVSEAHFNVLQQLAITELYIDEHLSEL